MVCKVGVGEGAVAGTGGVEVRLDVTGACPGRKQ